MVYLARCMCVYSSRSRLLSARAPGRLRSRTPTRSSLVFDPLSDASLCTCDMHMVTARLTRGAAVATAHGILINI